MDDQAAELSDIAQQVAGLIALAEKLSEYSNIWLTRHANDDYLSEDPSGSDLGEREALDVLPDSRAPGRNRAPLDSSGSLGTAQLKLRRLHALEPRIR
jgi:hypothetical protein